MQGSTAKQKGTMRALTALHSSEGCSWYFESKLTGTPWRRVGRLFLIRPHMHFSRLLPLCGPGRQRHHMLLTTGTKQLAKLHNRPGMKNDFYVSAWLHRKIVLISLPLEFRLPLFFAA